MQSDDEQNTNHILSESDQPMNQIRPISQRENNV